MQSHHGLYALLLATTYALLLATANRNHGLDTQQKFLRLATIQLHPVL